MATVTEDNEPQRLAVADAALESWRVAGHSAQVLKWSDVAEQLGVGAAAPISVTVVVPQAMHIECVLEDTAPLSEVRSALSALRTDGWAVRALLPVSAMGQAHEALRGLDIGLQGWWCSEGRSLRFASPEVP